MQPADEVGEVGDSLPSLPLDLPGHAASSAAAADRGGTSVALAPTEATHEASTKGRSIMKAISRMAFVCVAAGGLLAGCGVEGAGDAVDETSQAILLEKTKDRCSGQL